MPFHTPTFWYPAAREKPPTLEYILTPLCWTYRWGHALNSKLRKPSQRAACPVICIGNATAGGSGKTPTAIALQTLITQKKLAHNPIFLTRGYGGSEPGPYEVTQNENDPKRTGDEPLILAKHGKTIISKNRISGARKAQEMKADLIIMDDGLQNPSLHKDLSLLVIDGARGFGNNKLLPAGPLREDPADLFQKIQAVILIGEDKTEIMKSFPPSLPIIKASIQAQPHNTLDLNTPYIAFAGLGWPDKFKTMLENLGINLIDFRPFPDHHPYTEQEIQTLLQTAWMRDAKLITTEKDYVKIHPSLKEQIEYLPIALVWEDESAIVSLIKKAIETRTLQ